MKGIMIQGTASNTGKSFIVSAICRLLRNEGYSISPFKAQNFTNNIFLNKYNEKIAVSQAIQAKAAKVEPSIWMNPLILTLSHKKQSQRIVLGQPTYQRKETIDANLIDEESIAVIKKSLKKLENHYDMLVLEGAGSPVELNLKASDVANMKTAEIANVPVILVSSIHEGGVFASIVGTLELLEANERNRVKGIIINKFQGNLEFFQDAIQMIEQRTNIPVLGVIPFLHKNEEMNAMDLLHSASALDRVAEKVKPYLDIQRIKCIAGLSAND